MLNSKNFQATNLLSKTFQELEMAKNFKNFQGIVASLIRVYQWQPSGKRPRVRPSR